jgi:hypothetical protein
MEGIRPLVRIDNEYISLEKRGAGYMENRRNRGLKQRKGGCCV